MIIDHPAIGETIPIETGFLAYDANWVWLARENDGIVGVLVGARAHDVVLLLELKKIGDGPLGWIVPLFRHVARECRERGFERFLTLVTDETKGEVNLGALCERKGLHGKPARAMVYAGRIERFTGALCKQ
jgi:hypothetical protein